MEKKEVGARSSAISRILKELHIKWDILADLAKES